MATNPYINRVDIQRGNSTETLINISDTTAVASDVAQGKYFYLASGEKATGTLDKASGSVYQDADGFLVVDDSESSAPQGNLSITANGTYDVADYAGASVSVAGEVPSGVKYIYTDIDGSGAWDVSMYAKCSVDYAPVRDGLSRLWIRLEDSSSLTVQLYFYYSTSTTYTINWGDGVTDTFTSSGHSRPNHLYETIGNYVIEIDNGGILSNYTMTNGSSSVHDQILYGVETSYIGTGKNYAFTHCDNLIRATIGNGATSVGTGYFTECASLVDVVLPDSLTTIGSTFCRDNTSLKSITIPANVTSIGSAAFADMDRCTVHMMAETPPAIEANTFSKIATSVESVAKIYVPSGCLSAYQTAQNWSTYASIMEEE